MNRIAILIDGNNFYKGCQLNFNRTDVDFRKLGQKLSREIDGELLRIYYYNAHVSKSIDPLGFQRQQKFFDNLRATPYITLKLGHLVYHRLRNEQGFSSQYFPTEKGIDVQIAVDMIRLALLKACDGIILVSGDSDYIYAVRFVKDLGTNVYISSFPMGGSTELRNEGDGAVIMDHEFLRDCFIRAQTYPRREYGEGRIIDASPTYGAGYRDRGGQPPTRFDDYVPSDREEYISFNQNNYYMTPEDDDRYEDSTDDRDKDSRAARKPYSGPPLEEAARKPYSSPPVDETGRKPYSGPTLEEEQAEEKAPVESSPARTPVEPSPRIPVEPPVKTAPDSMPLRTLHRRVDRNE